MADFEELKLTVTLVDDASAGLASIRTQLTQLTQTAGQVQTALSGVASGAQQVGQAHQQATPHVNRQEAALKELTKSAEETTRGLLQMGLAARRGAEAWPELILSTREAWTGMKGATAAMGELGVASRAMVLGLGGVALGIAAVGAAVVAYGISVFKFSQEMYTLSQTSKALGMSFGQLRNMTEQNERFGISVNQTVAQLGQMNEALTDLTLSGSQLRQQLLSQGVPAQWIDDYKKLTTEVDRYNKVREAEKTIHDDWLKRTGSEEIASTMAGRFGKQLGVDPTAWTRAPMEQPTREELEQGERIAKQSELIAEQWRQIQKTISDIKTEFLAWGLPGVLDVIRGINEGLKSTKEMFEEIGKAIEYIKGIIPDWLGSAIGKGLRIEGGALGGLITGGPIGALKGGYRAYQGSSQPSSGPSDSFGDRWDALKSPSSFRSSGGGANDNVNPLLHRASFGGDDSGGGGGRAQAVIKAGVYEALVDFATYARTGGSGAGGGGIQNASYTPGGNVEGPAGGGATGLHSGGGYTVLGPNAAGSAGLPGGGYRSGGSTRTSAGGARPAETSGETVTAAQGGSDLDKDAYDKMFKGTPLEGKYDKVVETAKANNVPPSLMAGIMAHETGRGTSAMLQNKNNPAGIMDGSTGRSFSNVDAGIEQAGKTIAKNYQAGGGTIEGMQKSYAPIGAANDPRGLNSGWAAGVRKYQGQLAAATNPASASGYSGVGDYNFMGSSRARALGMGDVTPGSAAAQVKFPTGIPKGQGPQEITANKYAGTDIAGFLKDLHEAGAPLDNYSGVYANRSKRGGGGASQHAYGNALDLETGFGSGPTNSPKLYAWAQAHPEQFAAIQAAHHMRNLDTSSGAHMHDWGHFEWTPADKAALAKNAPTGAGAGILDDADRSSLAAPLDRAALNDNNKIHSTGKLDVSVNAPPGTKVNYHGQNLLKNTSMQRQTQMMPTSVGPNVADTAQSYMRGGT